MREDLILVVDDELTARRSLATVLEREGYRVAAVSDAFAALRAFEELAPALVITDLSMPGMNGIELLKQLKLRDAGAAVVVVTAFADVDSAVEAMRDGALDYLRKPLDVDALLRVVEKALRQRQLRRATLPPTVAADSVTATIVGTSQPMQRIFKSIEQVAPSRATVLITGESGTGKEAIAVAIHERSPRAHGPLVRLNCAALSESLLESELFGHERGSFTGAEKRRRGRIEQAHGGTLFLDEIGEISPALQVKLLRVLQERAFERVGGNETVEVDVRIVAATNRDLRELVARGEFREDLFYRLNVVNIHVPPLRERPSDIPALATHFLSKHRANDSLQAGFSDASLEALVGRDWPGNVRQLENAIERAMVFAGGGPIEPQHLPTDLGAAVPAQPLPSFPGASMDEVERYAILKTMEAVGGSTRKTAQLLGISIRKVQYRLREYSSACRSQLPAVKPEHAA